MANISRLEAAASHVEKHLSNGRHGKALALARATLLALRKKWGVDAASPAKQKYLTLFMELQARAVVMGMGRELVRNQP